MKQRNPVTSAIYGLLKKWDNKGFSPSAINTGNCDAFANELQDKFPTGCAIWGEDYPELFDELVDPHGHCFFSYERRYYDSECPKGVTSPVQLPYYQRQRRG
jgi:hypothetical protein